MIRLLVLLVVSGLLAWAGHTLFADPGEVVINSNFLGTLLGPDFAGEVTLTFAQLVVLIILIAIAVLVLVFLLRFGWAGLVWVYHSISGGDPVGRELRGYRALTHGLIAAAAGDKAASDGMRLRAEKALGATHPGTLLLAAETAEIEGNAEIAHTKYRQMMRTPETAFLGVKGLLSDAIASGDDEVALDLARRAFRLRPNNPWVVDTLVDLLVRDGQWKEALTRVNALAGADGTSSKEANHKAAVIGHMLAQSLVHEGKLDEAWTAAREAAQRDRTFAPASIGAAAIANERGQARQAEQELEAAFAAAPHPDLVKAYLELGGDNSAGGRSARFAKLFRKNNVSAGALAARIELTLAAGDAAAAQVAADQLATNRKATAGGLRAAADAYRATDANSPRIDEFTRLADQAPADPAWVCEASGQVVESWAPFGPDGDFDSLRWQSPPKVATFVGEVTDAAGFKGTTVEA